MGMDSASNVVVEDADPGPAVLNAWVSDARGGALSDSTASVVFEVMKRSALLWFPSKIISVNDHRAGCFTGATFVYPLPLIETEDTHTGQVASGVDRR